MPKKSYKLIGLETPSLTLTFLYLYTDLEILSVFIFIIFYFSIHQAVILLF